MTLLTVAGRPRLQSVLRWLAVVTLGTNLLYGASIFVIDRPSSGYLTFWDGWLFTIASLLPAGLVAIKAGLDRRRRGAWWMIAAGIGLNAAGNLIYTYHDQNLRPIPFPGPSDMAYLASYLAFAVGLMMFMYRESQDGSRATLLDGLVVGLAGGAVAVALWFEPVLAQTGNAAEVLVGLAYPLFDVVFIVIVLGGLAPQRYRPSPATAAFMIGAGIFAFGDVAYLNLLAADSYEAGTWLELTWSIGVVCFAAASWLPLTRRSSRATELKVGLAGIPGFCAMAALVVISLGLAGGVPPLASALAVASVAVALTRVWFSLHEVRRANEGFRQARTDDLTALMNRRGFTELLDRRLAGGDPLQSVLIVDLDGFKEVNDSLGHHAGDRLLAIVGERFARAVPEDGVVARLGGDEFGVALPGDQVVAVPVAEALLGSLADPVALEGISIRVGASVGLACVPEHGTSRDQLLRAADVAMYDAKRTRRGFSVYEADRDPHSRVRLALIEDLRVAIDQRAFEIHYQPTIDIDSDRVVGMEALIRWPHHGLGLLPPDDFIPMAEQVGLIPAITRAVLDQSIADLARTRAGGHDLRLSVNVSASDLVDDDLPAYVGAGLAQHGLAPDLLTVEITETALASDPVRARRTLHALRALGIRISIDDFGVGYSSMSQLLELPVDELKLDRSFVSNLVTDVRAQAILSATVELGRTLGLEVVAEGIETELALDEVMLRGVDIAQGFYFSPGLPVDELCEFLATRLDLEGTAAGA